MRLFFCLAAEPDDAFELCKLNEHKKNGSGYLKCAATNAFFPLEVISQVTEDRSEANSEK